MMKTLEKREKDEIYRYKKGYTVVTLFTIKRHPNL